MNRTEFIPMVDLQKEIDLLKAPLLKEMKTVLKSGEYVLGAKGKELENQIAAYTGTAHAVGVANGTDALYLSLKALNIGPGDEVITTPFTFFATAEAIALTGAVPVFADIKEQTYTIDPEKIKEAVTTKTKAVIVVHLFGKAADMEDILELAEKYNMKVIEDACQAVGTKIKDKKAGGIGNIGCFSFFPSKNLGAFGDGGMIVTNEQNICDNVRELRNHGSQMRYQHSSIGVNSRLDEMQAAGLLVKLKYLDLFLHKRKEIAKRYTEQLNRYVKTPETREQEGRTYHQYCIETAQRDELAAHLKKSGIASAVYYPVPLHLQEAFHYLGHQKGSFPVSEKTAERILALPIYPELSIKKQNYIISNVIRFFDQQKD
ncbi:DegT/DnrJ/EryC1/StrS family aminotransferase [Salibacterium halotolerans]|uniref:dTDP-4-amino-4,6-dideoxygalactose transaminase n=1 Tax=Salibacterium halotolerans TaxID=1884432 RepID=A0A1I5XIE1_9BACI|nr:DegT/DnrJ/EryC1/StrS family aminotransferase [Salibacterium halotolerans]SFQ31745.1 dTDP-4-amino-4,6-dideoxygalactose transaminase [Salibacterium halotolerans]